MKKAKLIVFHSPVAGSGQTLVATLAALKIAKEKNLVLYIELDRTASSSPYLHKRIRTAKESIKSVLERVDTLNANTVSSVHSNNFFYLSLNPYSSLFDIVTYNSANIDAIIDKAEAVYDYIIVDLPSSLTDPATARIFSSNFKKEINQLVEVLTEDIKCMKVFNDNNAILSKKNIAKLNTTITINRSHNRYNDFMAPYMKKIDRLNVVNSIDIIEFPNMKYYANEGDLFNTGNSSMSREFYSNTDLLADIIIHDRIGIGTNAKEEKSDLKARLKDSKIKKDKKTNSELTRTNYTVFVDAEEVLNSPIDPRPNPKSKTRPKSIIPLPFFSKSKSNPNSKIKPTLEPVSLEPTITTGPDLDSAPTTDSNTDPNTNLNTDLNTDLNYFPEGPIQADPTSLDIPLDDLYSNNLITPITTSPDYTPQLDFEPEQNNPINNPNRPSTQSIADAPDVDRITNQPKTGMLSFLNKTKNKPNPPNHKPNKPIKPKKSLFSITKK